MKPALPLFVIALAMLTGCYPEDWAEVTPDGKALVTSNMQKGVFWMTLDGKQCKRLGRAGWNPKVSPDGRYCVFTEWGEDAKSPSHCDFVLYDLASDARTFLRSWKVDQAKDEAVFILPSWRPDGKEIAYVVWRFCKSGPHNYDPLQFTELRVVNIENHNDRNIDDRVGLFSSWSPDGARLAFMRSIETGTAQLPKECATLGELRTMLRDHSTKPVAGLVFNPYCHLSWLSNDRIMFGSIGIPLPASQQDWNDPREAAFVADVNLGTIKRIDATLGMSWRAFSSVLRVSPDRQRFLYGEVDPNSSTGPGPENKVVKLWCYNLAESKRAFLCEFKADAYPFWITNTKIGYYEDKDTIIIASIDDKDHLVVERKIDLTACTGGR